MAPPETPREELELSPGDRCEGYRIVALLAAGGMGEVYEAVHEPTGRTVAVKCLKVRHRNKEDARARMKMEAVVLSELQHENLVQVYDAGVTDSGMVWIAMERLHGQTLRDLLFRKGRLPISEALHYASEIADGVDAVHDVNVIHRDLKPENVFVTTSNVVKVLDLGTGKFTGYGLNSTDRMRVVGTTAYMSPEQIKGLRVDGRADVYALGLIVYEMIAGRHALTPEDGVALPQGVEQIAMMQLQMSPRPLARVAPSCPPYVSAMVERAIAKDRDRRFPNMATFARELRSLRKRFVAEHPSDGGGVVPFGEDLREKFGAPPRASDRPPRRASIPAQDPGSVALADTVAAEAVQDRQNNGDFATEIQPAVAFTLDPAASYVPTQILSSTSVPLPPAEAAGGDFTHRSPPPEEVRNRTTQTNPIGFVRAAPSSSDDSFEVMLRERSWHPVVRRIGVTLALGALIGVPPAVGGVLWARYRNGFSRGAAETQVAEKPATATVVEGPSNQPPAAAIPSTVSAETSMPSAVPTPPKVGVAAAKPRAKTTPGSSMTAPAGAGTADVAAASLVPRSPSEGVLVRPPRAKSKAIATTVGDEEATAVPDAKRSKLPDPPPAEDSSKTILPPSGL